MPYGGSCLKLSVDAEIQLESLNERFVQCLERDIRYLISHLDELLHEVECMPVQVKGVSGTVHPDTQGVFLIVLTEQSQESHLFLRHTLESVTYLCGGDVIADFRQFAVSPLQQEHHLVYCPVGGNGHPAFSRTPLRGGVPQFRVHSYLAPELCGRIARSFYHDPSHQRAEPVLSLPVPFKIEQHLEFCLHSFPCLNCNIINCYKDSRYEKTGKTVKKNPIGVFPLQGKMKFTNTTLRYGEKIHGFHQLTRSETGNDLVAEPSQYISFFGYSANV